MRTTIALFGIATLTACSKNIYFPATYVEKQPEDAILLEWERYTFRTANDFEYFFFTDAINYSKYGHGKYRVKNGKLVLAFSDQPFDTLRSKIEGRVIPSSDSSTVHYKLHIRSYSGENLELMGVCLLHVKNRKMETNVFTDSSGYAEMSLPSNLLPVTLEAVNLGYDRLTYRITSKESQFFEIKLAEKNFGSQITDQRWKKRIKASENQITVNETIFVKEAIIDQATAE